MAVDLDLRRGYPDIYKHPRCRDYDRNELEVFPPEDVLEGEPDGELAGRTFRVNEVGRVPDGESMRFVGAQRSHHIGTVEPLNGQSAYIHPRQ